MTRRETADAEIAKYKVFSVGLADCPTCLSNYGCDSWLDTVDEDDGSPIQGLESQTENAGDEGSFSWSGCDLCDNRLGGTLYAAHGVDEKNEITHYEICTDCMMYVANGEDTYEEEGDDENPNAAKDRSDEEQRQYQADLAQVMHQADMLKAVIEGEKKSKGL